MSTPPSVSPAFSPSPSPSPLLSPILNSISTPYDEDTIVELITDLYKLLIDLGYISESDIAWPPPEEGHALNEATCEELHLNQKVSSLIRRLPYPKNPEVASDFHLYPDSYGYCLLDDRTLRSSRDPTVVPCDDSQPPRLDYLLSHDVAFSWNHRDGMCLILDTKDNTIRMLGYCSRYTRGSQDFPPERPEDPDHYRNRYSEHAPSYLSRLLKQIRTLKLIPARIFSGWLEYYMEYDRHEHALLKKALTEEYGWPNDFRREDFRRDKEKVWERAIEAGMAALSSPDQRDS